MFTRLLLLTSFCLLAEPIFARQGSVTFESPIDCKFGENCDIVLFVDHDKHRNADYRWNSHMIIIKVQILELWY